MIVSILCLPKWVTAPFFYTQGQDINKMEINAIIMVYLIL